MKKIDVAHVSEDSRAGLPEGFEDLEQFADWALATESERNHKRINSSITEINAFAKTMLDRVEEIGAYLNKYDITELSPEQKTLFFMMLSLAEVAPAIEFYKSPTVTNGYDSRRFAAQEDFPLRPEI